jgi:hypothetical protein
LLNAIGGISIVESEDKEWRLSCFRFIRLRL